MLERMVAVRKMRPGRGFDVVEVPLPEPERDEVLVGVEAASICGTDLHMSSETADWLVTNNGGPGVDIVLEMSGAPSAVDAAFRGVRNGGRVTLFGIPSNPVQIDVVEQMILRPGADHSHVCRDPVPEMSETTGASGAIHRQLPRQTENSCPIER